VCIAEPRPESVDDLPQPSSRSSIYPAKLTSQAVASCLRSWLEKWPIHIRRGHTQHDLKRLARHAHAFEDPAKNAIL